LISSWITAKVRPRLLIRITHFTNKLIALMNGDSGLWVIRKSSNELYGHVVFADMFGEISLVPAEIILDDIRRSLKAHSVTVSSDEDIAPAHSVDRYHKQQAQEAGASTRSADTTTESPWIWDPEMRRHFLVGPDLSHILLDDYTEVPISKATAFQKQHIDER
jgi:hypothetical protein